MMIWDSIYFFLNSTIGGTLEPLDVMVKRLKNELATEIANVRSDLSSNHAGYRGIVQEWVEPGNYWVQVPYGAKKVKITANAGGGGAGYGAYGDIRAGGNGASVTGKEYTVPNSLNYFILTIGGAGESGSYDADGGDTIIGSILTLGGGKHGTESSPGAAGTGGTGATPQDSLNGKNWGSGQKDRHSNPTNGWCRLEWVF